MDYKKFLFKDNSIEAKRERMKKADIDNMDLEEIEKETGVALSQGESRDDYLLRVGYLKSKELMYRSGHYLGAPDLKLATGEHLDSLAGAYRSAIKNKVEENRTLGDAIAVKGGVAQRGLKAGELVNISLDELRDKPPEPEYTVVEEYNGEPLIQITNSIILSDLEKVEDGEKYFDFRAKLDKLVFFGGEKNENKRFNVNSCSTSEASICINPDGSLFIEDDGWGASQLDFKHAVMLKKFLNENIHD